MKKIVTVLLVLVFAKASAQNYLISFAGNGASSTIDSIKVQNLMQGTSVTISGTDTLNLLGTNGVKSSLNQDNKLLQIYPNPSEQTSLIKIEKTESGPTSIDVFNISGKRIIHSDFDLGLGEHEFQISNLNPGLHQIVVSSPNHVVIGKILSQYGGNTTTVLRHLNVNGTSLKGSRINVTTAYVAMQYTQGERLLLTAYSGNYKSVKTIVPTASGLYSFTFFACTDVDNNNYATVQIGTQVWMAENLKVSKYRNGDPITTNLSDAAWNAATTGAYSIYNNDPSNNTTYGKLYNWYAVADSRNLCPVGWHVPSDGEWKTLEISLGMSAADADLAGARGTAQNVGGKLKSTSSLWNAPNTGATNESGFSGLPGGNRLSNGTYYIIGLNGGWWSSTVYSTTYAWGHGLGCLDGFSYRGVDGNRTGYSVRCLKD